MKLGSAALLGLFWKMGGIGLLALGILDSSFLFAPLGNDLLVVAMTARHHSVARMLYYSAMSTVGSVVGCLLVDLVMRTAGEKGLVRHLSRVRLNYVKQKVQSNAAWALVLSAVAPPPFPFTPFIMAAAALQYPRARMLAIVGAARMARFTLLGVLALRFGRRILLWAQSALVQDVLVGLIVVCVVGSGFSVVWWIQRSRDSRDQSRQPSEPAPTR